MENPAACFFCSLYLMLLKYSVIISCKMINGKRSGSTQEAHTNRPSFAYFNTREYCKSIRIKDKQQSTCAKRKISFFKSDLPAVHLIKYMRNI